MNTTKISCKQLSLDHVRKQRGQMSAPLVPAPASVWPALSTPIASGHPVGDLFLARSSTCTVNRCRGTAGKRCGPRHTTTGPSTGTSTDTSTGPSTGTSTGPSNKAKKVLVLRSSASYPCVSYCLAISKGFAHRIEDIVRAMMRRLRRLVAIFTMALFSLYE